MICVPVYLNEEIYDYVNWFFYDYVIYIYIYFFFIPRKGSYTEGRSTASKLVIRSRPYIIETGSAPRQSTELTGLYLATSSAVEFKFEYSNNCQTLIYRASLLVISLSTEVKYLLSTQFSRALVAVKLGPPSCLRWVLRSRREQVRPN